MTTISREQVIYNLGWLKGVVDMGIKEDDQMIKDDVAEAIDDILGYIAVEK